MNKEDGQRKGPGGRLLQKCKIHNRYTDSTVCGDCLRGQLAEFTLLQREVGRAVAIIEALIAEGTSYKKALEDITVADCACPRMQPEAPTDRLENLRDHTPACSILLAKTVLMGAEDRILAKTALKTEAPPPEAAPPSGKLRFVTP